MGLTGIEGNWNAITRRIDSVVMAIDVGATAKVLSERLDRIGYLGYTMCD